LKTDNSYLLFEIPKSEYFDLKTNSELQTTLSLLFRSFVILVYARIHLGKASELAHNTFEEAQMLH